MPNLVVPAQQQFECRDCPARCCTAPWKITITADDKDRYEAQPWIQERFAQHHAAITPTGDGDYALPGVVRHRRLECIFLDSDHLCSMYKRHGREFWPSTCRSFPFQFLADVQGNVRMAASHYCPSIRDNYGLPLTAERAEGFLRDYGNRAKQAWPHLKLGVQTQLTAAQYFLLVEAWAELVQNAPTVRGGLLAAHVLTAHVETTLLEKVEVDDTAFQAALTAAHQAPVEAMPAPGERQTALLPNLILGLYISHLAFPIRTYTSTGFSPARIVASWRERAKLIREVGSVDLLLLPQPVRLEAAAGLPAILTQPALESRLRTFMVEVLRRRQFRQEPSLATHLFQITLGFVIILRVARYHAAARGSASVELADVLNGMSAAELLVLFHAYPPGVIMDHLMAVFSGNPMSVRRLLLSEA